MVQPIRPQDVPSRAARRIPDEVIAAFNKLIAEKMSGDTAVVRQADVVNEIVATSGLTKQDIFHGKYLDVEELFADAGWKVRYTKPAYCETFEAYFEFCR